jgi:hypothetical protein
MADIFAHYDEVTAKVKGFFSNELHSEIPEPNIKITEEQWQTCLQEQGTYKVLEGNFITVRPSSLDIKAQMKNSLNNIYIPQFDELERAYGRSDMIGDSENAASIKEEYRQLWAEYNAKMEEIENG